MRYNNRLYDVLLVSYGSSETTNRFVSYLDLHFKIDSEARLTTILNDKRDDFNFSIVNFPFICSNIPAAYWVYISQMIRFSIACGSYHDFLDQGMLLTRNLLNQGLLLFKVKSSHRMFYGRYHDLAYHYGISVSQITMDMFHFS
jgi:hypothetical protein